MNKFLNNFYYRFRSLMLDAFSGNKQVIMTDELPAPLFNQVKEIENRSAVSAIEGYLATLEIGPIYPFIITLIFPKALICGFIDFAYEVLAYSEYFHKKIDIGDKTLFGYVPWRETKARLEFDKCIIDLENEENRRKNSNNKLLLCSANDVLLNGTMRSFMNKYAERKKYENFDIDFAIKRIDNLIYLYSELRNRKIISD